MSYFVDAIASADNIRITPSLRSKKGKLLKMSAEYLPYLGLYNAHWMKRDKWFLNSPSK
jgi:hypothetical protein